MIEIKGERVILFERLFNQLKKNLLHCFSSEHETARLGLAAPWWSAPRLAQGSRTVSLCMHVDLVLGSCFMA